MRFDDEARRRLEAIYLTADVTGHRQQVLRRLAPAAGERVLDVGCGPGLLSIELARAVGSGGLVRGVDASPEMIEAATQRCAGMPHAAFEVADAQKLPFGDAEFDVLVCTQVLEYVPDVERALAEFRRVMRPGARLLLMDTDWESCVWHSGDDDRMRRMIAAWDTHCPHPRLPRVLAALLKQCGFDAVAADALPLVNAPSADGTYSGAMISMLSRYGVRKGEIPEVEARAWEADLVARSDRGEYFFSLNRFVFEARRP